LNRIPLKLVPLIAVFTGFFLTSSQSCADFDKSINATWSAPVVIAHRGASGQRPEHTLSAYELALVEGADFIELDLVATRDGVLVARHENALAVAATDSTGQLVRDAAGRPDIVEATTDVAEHEAFADRLTVKRIDGRLVGGWFTEDFTLAELRQLQARERMPAIRPGNALYDGTEGIPTLADVIGLLRSTRADAAARAGLYIELKHPTYFALEGRRLDGASIGVDLGALLIDELLRLRFTDADRLFLQCFEMAPLIELKDRLAALGLGIPLIQLYGDVYNRRYRSAPWDMVSRARRKDLEIYGELATLVSGGITADISYADLTSPAVLAYLHRRYATGVGPPLDNVLAILPDAGGGNGTFTSRATPFFEQVRAAGLIVHTYTLRAEAPFLYQREGRLVTVSEELTALLDAGVNGFFIDQPAEGALAVARHRAALERAE